MIKKIGIYGIAANPPTFGHSHVIKSVLEANIVDEIWVVPSFIHFHGKQMAPYDIRVDMCRKAFLNDPEIDSDRISIKTIEHSFSEIINGYDGSTISLMTNLRKLRQDDFYVIIGQDNADSIETWKNGDLLIHNEKFIVLPRPYNEGGFRKGEVLVMSGVSDGKSLLKWYNNEPNIFLPNIQLVSLSSTMARSLCKGKTVHDALPKEINGIVCNDVLDVIFEHTLYLGEE